MSRRFICSRHFPGLLFASVAFIFVTARADSRIEAADEESRISRIGVVLARSSEDAAVIDSLCRMGLLETAIARCRSGIEGTATGTLPQARWIGLLIESVAERDSERANSIQDALSEAKKIYEAYTNDPKNQATAVWVDYAYESVRLKLIGRSVANFLAAPTNVTRRDDALETIRSLLDHLLAIKEQAHAQLGVTLRLNDRDSAIRARELGSLHNRLSLLEIDCMLMRCDCYPPDSAERIAAGTEALSAIDKITGRIESDWSGQELLDLARHQSLVALSRYGDAAQSLTRWIASVDDPSHRNRGIALLAKAYQMKGDFGAAVKALLNADANALQESPEIALATLELQIASWKKQAGQVASPKPTIEEGKLEIERILKTKEHIADRFGNYWRQRAEALIVESSLGSPNSLNSQAQSTSLDLLKVNIRQRLAAGDSSGAIELLDQAEAASLLANDLKQAFGFAKSAIGVMQQQFAGTTSISLQDEQAIIDRIASTARKYSDDETSAQLHQFAIERQKKLLAAETNTTNSESLAESYQQILLDHVTTWPDHPSSDGIRGQLQLLYLNTAEVSALLELWSHDIEWLTAISKDTDPKQMLQLETRMATATVCYVNAKLLSSLVGETRNEAQPGVPRVLDNFPLDSQWIIEALTADYDGWTFDGGIRSVDGQSITWSLPTNTFEKNASAASIHRILSNARKSELVDIQSDIQRVIDWVQADYQGRIAWMAALHSQLSNILRLRTLSDGYDRPSKEWLNSLGMLQTAMQEGLNASQDMLHPKLYEKLKEHAVIAEARINVMRGDADAGFIKIEQLQREDARSPRWTLELARLYELQDARSEKALALYRQLATGSSVGSEVWFESRWSSVRCLRRQGKLVEADQLVSLVHAMIADIPKKWEQRLK